MISEIIRRIYRRIYIAEFLEQSEALQPPRHPTQEYWSNLNRFCAHLENFFSRLHQPAPRAGKRINNSLTNEYPEAHELLARLQLHGNSQDLSGIPNMLDSLRTTLLGIYPSVLIDNPFKRRTVKWVAVAIAAILITAAVTPPITQKYREEIKVADLVRNREKYALQTLRDLEALRKALESYYVDNKQYPKSSGGWDAVDAAFGESRKDWIPGLAPRYISSLPSDPRKFRTTMEQYMYKSDGKDYKLIAHFPVNVAGITDKDTGLVDPIRPSWSIGVWTKNAKSW